MGSMQRTKGQQGECEIAALLRDLTGYDVRRRVRQHDGDSDLEGVPGWSVEVKRAAKPLLNAWWKQAVEQSKRGNCLPVLFYRLDRQEWRARWPIGIFLGIQHADMWRDIEYTSDTTVECWTAVMREIEARAEG